MSRTARTPRQHVPAQKRVGALDGIRALAIISVVLYHLNLSWLPSGHMGVVIFLVLSGYLITSSLIKQLRSHKKIDYPTFLTRRLLRIWPPAAIVIFSTVAACVLFNHVLLTKLKPDFLPSLLLISNLASIARGASYFDNLGGTSPLMHLWYLGLDMQFALIWPCVLAGLWKLGARQKRASLPRRSTFVLALLSAVAMAILFDPNQDPTRVYYGPDTRFFAPLAGAWLALLWPLGVKSPRSLKGGSAHPRCRTLDILGACGLIGIILIMVLVPDISPFLYRGGMALVAVLTCLLIASVLRPDTFCSRALVLPGLSWLAMRSFGIYLWHFPLFQLLSVTQNTTPWWVTLVALAATILLSELTYRYVEMPLQAMRAHAGEKNSAAQARRFNVRDLSRPQLIGIAFSGAVVLVALIGALVVPDEYALPQEALNNTGQGAAEAVDLSGNTDGQTEDSSGGASSDAENESQEDPRVAASQEIAQNASPDDHLILTAQNSGDTPSYTPFIIADSVAGDSNWYFSHHCPNGYLDSYVGRRPDQAIEVLESYLDQGVVGQIVVLSTFSNNVVTKDQIKQLIDDCQGRSIYLVNVRIPQSEQAQINQALADAAETYDNVQLIDWNSFVAGHEDGTADAWLYPDGTHLTPAGQPHYIDLITSAIAKDFVAQGGTAEKSEIEQRLY
ncbi:MAG: acyltransferase family protein [Atopobiaceae bacterium]|jgi:peptidoglycan/LPS O-acetylase OafA/YrhL